MFENPTRIATGTELALILALCYFISWEAELKKGQHKNTLNSSASPYYFNRSRDDHHERVFRKTLVDTHKNYIRFYAFNYDALDQQYFQNKKLEIYCFLSESMIIKTLRRRKGVVYACI